MIIHFFFFFFPNWITSTKSISSSLLIFTCCSCPSAMFLILMPKTSGFWWLSSLYLICKLPAGINRAKDIVHYVHNRQCRSYTMSLLHMCIWKAKQMFDLFNELTMRNWHKWEIKEGNMKSNSNVGSRM